MIDSYSPSTRKRTNPQPDLPNDFNNDATPINTAIDNTAGYKNCEGDNTKMLYPR